MQNDSILGGISKDSSLFPVGEHSSLLCVLCDRCV